MKRGGDGGGEGGFFSHFSWGDKKGGQLTFYSIFSWGEKYAARCASTFNPWWKCSSNIHLPSNSSFLAITL